MNLSFRQIETKDFSICAENLMAAYIGKPWNNRWTKKEALLRIVSIMSGSNSRGYLAEKNDEIVAMCLGRIDYYYNNWSQYCIDEFNVIPTQQGIGVGRDLLAFISNVMKNEEIDRVFLLTGGEQAANFYQNNGFVKSNDGIIMDYDLQNN